MISQKPTYEALEQKNREVEKELTRLKQYIKDELEENIEKLRTIFENASDVIVYTSKDGTIIDVNDRIEDLLGYKRESVVGRKFFEFPFFSPEVMENCIELLKDIIQGKPAPMLEFKAFKKDRSEVFFEVNSKVVEKNGEIRGILNIIRDVSERKQTEAILKKYSTQLENLVKERTVNLEESNTALKVLLKKRAEDKAELEEKMLHNIQDLIFPYLDVLEESTLTSRQKAHIDIVRSNLNDIASPLVRGLSSQYLKLTHTEIKIANLVKHGKTTKEIAAMNNLAIKTIEFHRDNIRKKLDIKHSKINLRTYLLSIQ